MPVGRRPVDHRGAPIQGSVGGACQSWAMEFRRAAEPPLPPPVAAAAGEGRPVEVEIRRSARRRRTAQARWEAGRIVVMVPAGLPGREEQRLVEGLVAKVTRSAARPRTRGDQWLGEIAVRVARAHLDPVVRREVRASSIRWVSTMERRWGSCTIGTGRIRIADTLGTAPLHVVEAVVFHELVHLVEPGHTARFRSLEALYPQHDLARNWLRGWSAGHAAASREAGRAAAHSDADWDGDDWDGDDWDDGALD